MTSCRALSWTARTSTTTPPLSAARPRACGRAKSARAEPSSGTTIVRITSVPLLLGGSLEHPGRELRQVVDRLLVLREVLREQVHHLIWQLQLPVERNETGKAG